MRQEASAMDGNSAQDLNQDNDCTYWLESESERRKLEDEYLLGDIIGRGAFSTVYKCLRKGRTEWACKVLKKKLLDKKSFQREIQSLLELKHPNIVQLRDVFETSDEIQLIFELANGGELFERIVQKGRYTEEVAAQAVKNILNALRYLHGKGMVHRGVKPENLLYQSPTEDSVLKLSDFGMSRLFVGESQATNRACGTYGLYAPEILQSQEYDSSIDLWSLGVVTYIMLCGFEPFWDEQSQTITYKNIMEGNFSFSSPWWDKVSDSAKDIVSKMLSTDPKCRPTTEEALNHPWVLGTSISSLPMNETVIKLREFNARRRFRVATTAVIATKRALSYLPIIKSRERQDKAVQDRLLQSLGDGARVKSQCEEVRIAENACGRPLLEGTSNERGKLVSSLDIQSVDGRATSDLEKRRLEAELKAAEEMAKIKEVVIEKRLAFELASLEDASESLHPAYLRDVESLSRYSSKTDNGESLEVPARSRTSITTSPKPLNLDSFLRMSSTSFKKLSLPSEKMTTRAPNIETKSILVTKDSATKKGSEEKSMPPAHCEEEASNDETSSQVEEDDCESDDDTRTSYAKVQSRTKMFWKSMLSKFKSKLKIHSKNENKW